METDLPSAVSRVGQDAMLLVRLIALRMLFVARTYAKAGLLAPTVWIAVHFISIIPDESIRVLTGIAALVATSEIVTRFLRTYNKKDLQLDDRTVAISQLKQTIGAFGARLPNWDGIGGAAPSPEAIADALTFVGELPDFVDPPDDVFGPGDGEIMFQWRRPGTFVEVGFYGDSTISWYSRSSTGTITFGDDPFDRKSVSDIPFALRNALEELTANDIE